MLGSGGAASSSQCEDPAIAAAALELWNQCQLEDVDTGTEDGKDTDITKPSVVQRPQLEGATEESHVGALRLRDGTCKAGPCQVLEHLTTGEVVVLATDEHWSLKISHDTGLGLVYSKVHKMWVNKLLKCSVHESAQKGQHFVVHRVPTSDHEQLKHLYWLWEWHDRTEAHWLSWPASGGTPSLPVAKVTRIPCPGELGFRMFWSLQDWWVAAACSEAKTTMTKQMQAAKRRFAKKFPDLDAMHFGVDEAVSKDKRFGDRLTRVSTKCLLLILCEWSVYADNNLSPFQPLKLLEGLCKTVFDHCSLTLSKLMCPELPESATEAVMMILGDKMIFMDNIPRIGSLKQRELLLSHCLHDLYESDPPAVSIFLSELATAIEDALPQSWLSSCRTFLPARVAQRSSPTAPLDADVVAELRELQGSTAIRTTKSMNKVTRALQLGVHGGDHFLDTVACRRLALASQRAFGASMSLCAAVDAKRFGGKHWLAGALGCTETHIFTFANPVAPYFVLFSCSPALPNSLAQGFRAHLLRDTLSGTHGYVI